MARTETFEAKVYLNQKEAQNAMAELEAQIVDTGAALKKFNEEKNSKKSIEAEQHLKRLRKQYEEAKHGVENYRKALDNLNGQSLNELIRMQKALKRELDRTKPDTEEWKRMAKEYQQVTERIDSLKKAQKGIVTEGQKSTNAFKTLFGKVNEFYGGLLVYAKAAKAAFQAIIGVTKQVVNASQTMGDKWNNGMAAMKTATEAFFFSLSTGDWTAFENGIASVLKKARQLAETMDLLGSYNIAEGYMQSKYLTDFQQNITTATDTEATEEERRKALDDAKADLEAYNEFIEGKAAATYKALQEEFDVYLGKTFESQAEFDQFFDKLFRGHKEITSVRIPDTVTDMGEFLFDGCENLRHLELPAQLRVLWGYTFARCGIEEAYLPEGLRRLPPFAFKDCKNLRKVVCGAGMEKIHAWAFSGCDQLSEEGLICGPGTEVSPQAFDTKELKKT